MDTIPTMLIGCGGMGRHQATLLRTMDGIELGAVCDRDAQAAQRLAGELTVAAETEVVQALIRHRPQLVVITTGNSSHCDLVCLAAEHRARAIYVEKPMAVDASECARMREACRRHGTQLVVGHQRRLGADLKAMREAILSGAIGRVRRLILQCAGDLLSDGTHLLDSLDFLLDGLQPEWIQASLHRCDPATQPPSKDGRQDRAPGWRFGHPVECGLVATLRYGGGIVVELRCGDAVEPYTDYQCYEVEGSAGRLWRPGDPGPKLPTGNVFINDGRPGDHAASWRDDDWPYRPVPQPAGGSWRSLLPTEECTAKMGLIGTAYRLLIDSLRCGSVHPMDVSVGERATLLAMRIYEAAVSAKRIRGDDAVPGGFPLRRTCEEAPLCSVAV